MSDDVAVFTSVLQALEDVGILSDIVIIGGWAQHLYRRYFNEPPELSALRTADIDILSDGRLSFDHAEISRKFSKPLDLNGTLRRMEAPSSSHAK